MKIAFNLRSEETKTPETRSLYLGYKTTMKELREKYGRNLWNPEVIREHYGLRRLSQKEWRRLKSIKEWSRIKKRIIELYVMGYKYWSVIHIITYEFGIYISGATVNKILRGELTCQHVIKDNLFKNADVVFRGGIERYRSSHAPALVLCAKELFVIARRKRIGIVTYFDNSLRKVYLKREDDSRKKLQTSSNRLIRVTFHYIPEKLRAELKNSKRIYVDVYLSSSEFGLTKVGFINDVDARSLFPYLKKYGFELPKRRITNNDKLGDLICVKDGKVILIEITRAFSSFNRTNQKSRHMLLGKLGTIALRSEMKDIMIVVLHNQVRENGLINEDFRLFVNHFGIRVIFTDFNQRWEEKIAERINKIVKTQL